MSIAVIGCGYWGKNLVRNFSQLGKLSVVCDATAAGRDKAKELAPDAKITADTAEVFGSDVAGVVIASPAETHYALVQESLNAGKDVFVEKPLALTYEQGVELVALARQKKRILMVGHVWSITPPSSNCAS